MQALPIGTVTFLFTDIEGSTKMWEEQPTHMQEALLLHDGLLTAIFSEQGGVVVKSKGEGDSFFVVFAVPSEAVRAACTVQKKLNKMVWPTSQPIRVRMALHTGEAELREGDYYGPAVNRCARLRAAAHGGQILLSAVAAQLVNGHLPSDITLRDLGSHRLKDLSAPEQVYQLVHPNMPDGFPQLRSLEEFQHNLPVQVTPFIGRASELKKLHWRLSQARLLSLLGPGGSGKTRLSLQLAAESVEEFPDGVWLAELAPLQDESVLYQTVASIFGLKESNRMPLTGALINYLQSKKTLLVLDNCEHLIEPCAMLTAAIIQKCPHVKVVVTSREPLNITGETIWRVPSLSLPNPDQPLSAEHLLDYEAVRLFVDRASATQHTFELTDHNARAVTDICHRLDGIPLALELAAARVRVLSVEQIGQRLNESFRLLSGGDRTRLPRQQTLRALVDWSHDLLNESERIMWRRLSVFAGSFPLEAAEAVCSGEGVEDFEVLDLISQLVDKSIVLSKETEGEIRYHLLETIRQYGQEKLHAGGERDMVIEKHCDYYLTFLEKSADSLRSPHMQAATIRQWGREMDNLRIAMDWSHQLAAADPEYLDKAGRLISAIPNLWLILGLAPEGYARFNAWLALPNSSQQTKTRFQVILAAVTFAADKDPQKSHLFIQESIDIARKFGDPSMIARALYSMAMGCNISGQFQRAVELFDEAYGILQGLKSDWEIAHLLRFKAIAMMNHRDVSGARSVAEQNVKLCREQGNTHDEAASYRILGILSMLEGIISDAKQQFRLSMEITCELDDKQCTLHGIGGISLVAEACAEPELAAWLGGAYEGISESIGYGMNFFISPTANDTWAALKADFPDVWAKGRLISYEEAVARARSFAGAAMEVQIN